VHRFFRDLLATCNTTTRATKDQQQTHHSRPDLHSRGDRIPDWRTAVFPSETTTRHHRPTRGRHKLACVDRRGRVQRRSVARSWNSFLSSRSRRRKGMSCSSGCDSDVQCHRQCDVTASSYNTRITSAWCRPQCTQFI